MMTLTVINGGLFHSLQNLSSIWHSADLKTFSTFYLQYMQIKVGRILIHGISFLACNEFNFIWKTQVECATWVCADESMSTGRPRTQISLLWCESQSLGKIDILLKNFSLNLLKNANSETLLNQALSLRPPLAPLQVSCATWRYNWARME
jgi:hypothetical protein